MNIETWTGFALNRRVKGLKLDLTPLWRGISWPYTLTARFFVISPHPVRASPVDWYARETKRSCRLNFYLVVHFLRCYVQEAHQSWLTSGPSLKLKRQEIQSLFHFGMDWGICDKSCFIWKSEKRQTLFFANIASICRASFEDWHGGFSSTISSYVPQW